MTQQVVTFTPDMPLSLALDQWWRVIYMGGPVIDETEQVIGFLSEAKIFCRETG